jgi:hypothetical protein
MASIGNNVSSVMKDLLPFFMLQNQPPSTTKGGNTLRNLLLFDVASKVLPQLGSIVANFVHHRVKSRNNQLYDLMRSSTGKRGSILLKREYSGQEIRPSDDMFDSVIARASDLPQTKFIRRMQSGSFMVETTDEIALGSSVFFKRIGMDAKEGAEISSMLIEVYSYEKDIVSLRDFLTDLEEKFRILRSNQLGRVIYYFDEFPQIPPPSMDGAPDLSRLPHNITFSMYPLHTNKSLSNVFGTSIQKVRKRVDFFVNNRSWYEKRGVPYTMGILLHGPPGCGKTSFIKAIARDCNRHVINMKLSKFTTVSQLNNLFYSGRVNAVRDGSSTAYAIPIEKTVIVIEDADCLTDIVLDRSLVKKKLQDEEAANADTAVFSEARCSLLIDSLASIGLPGTVRDQNAFLDKLDTLKKLKDMHAMKEAFDKRPTAFESPGDAQKLTLSILLNTLDGILETPGRILIMTSNHPERFDKALLRPGRIDSIVHFKKCSPVDIEEMILAICNQQVDPSRLDRLPDQEWTPAEVTQVIFENLEDIDAIMALLEAGKSRDTE